MEKISFSQAAQYGFVFRQAREWMGDDLQRMAHDANLITTPNTTVPAEFTAYIDPLVVEILTAPKRAREIFTEQKKGDWTTSYTKWEVIEPTGKTTPYSDYADGTTSGINVNWPTREQYLFQTTITYGDRESDMSGVAKLNLASQKQKAAAGIIDIDSNKFALLGVAGKEIYGILNDPNIPAAITAAAVGTGDSTYWADKSTVQIYNDILALFAELVSQSKGLIDVHTPLKLCMSPNMSVNLGSATGFNVNVQDMIEKYFDNISVVTVPELSSSSAGETMLMIAPEVNATPTGFIGFSEKLISSRVVPELSNFRQKFVSTTYGGVILQPFAIAQMTGI